MDNRCLNFDANGLQPTVNDSVIYEQPLNERMRTFLRMEQLMQRLHKAMDGGEVWQSHCALSIVIELVNLVMRVDVKNDLMLELERQGANLARLQAQDDVDQGRLQDIVDQQRELSQQLHGMSGQLAQHLMRNELLGSLRQRLSIPGGTCDFDLPAYHYWLSRSAERRNELLRTWIEPFEKVLEAVELVLGLIRDSAVLEPSSAARGFFQQALSSDLPNQLLRVRMPLHSEVFPEISAGKHRFTIRFLEQADITSRPTQTEQDVEFEFATCAL
jgi:cell division protein ZapD